MPIPPILNSLEFYNCSRLFPIIDIIFSQHFALCSLTSQAKCSHLIASVPRFAGCLLLGEIGATEDLRNRGKKFSISLE